MGSIDVESRGAVLVVDDDAELRSEIRDVLEAEQFFVLDADNGVDALEVLDSPVGSAVRLVILDLFMPFMTGWELVDFLCRDPRFAHLSLLVMSGLSFRGDTSKIRAKRFWLRKPFGATELVRAVNAVLSDAAEVGSDPSHRLAQIASALHRFTRN